MGTALIKNKKRHDTYIFMYLLRGLEWDEGIVERT